MTAVSKRLQEFLDSCMLSDEQFINRLDEIMTDRIALQNQLYMLPIWSRVPLFGCNAAARIRRDIDELDKIEQSICKEWKEKQRRDEDARQEIREQ